MGRQKMTEEEKKREEFRLRFNKAKNELSNFMVELIQKYNLTLAEEVTILAEHLSTSAGFEIRREQGR